jgi:hypothetical protein
VPPVAAILLGWYSAAASGQEVEIPGGRPMPTAFRPAPSFDGAPAGPRPAWGVWVAVANFPPRSRCDLAAPPVFGKRPFNFLEKCYVLMEYQVKDREFLLVGQPTVDGRGVSEVLGWVPLDYVIESERAKMVSATTIPVKAMIVNDVRKQETLVDEKGGFQEAIWTQAVPGELKTDAQRQAYQRKQYALFNIFWVYARTPPGPLGREEQAQDDAWLLIGSAPSFTIDPRTGTDTSAQVIEGWVPERRTLTWLTREALAWDQASTLPGASPRRQTPGAVFYSVKDAYAAYYPEEYTRILRRQPPARVEIGPIERFVTWTEYLQAAAQAGEEPAAATPTGVVAPGTDPGRVFIGYKPHHRRYPDLKWGRPEDPDDRKFLPFERVSNKSNELLRLGAIAGKGGLSPEEIADRDQRLDEIGQLLETTEILFVIDDTVSMKEHFGAVADAVEAIETDARNLAAQVLQSGGGTKGPPIKLAVAYYNDTEGQPEGHVPYTTMRLQPAAGLEEGFASKVRNHTAFEGGGLPRELVLNGLAHALDEAHFSPYSRKLVVLIGDMGDHSDENDPVPAQSVGRLFLPDSDAPREFISIQVVDPGRSEDAAAFDKQMRTLANYLNSHRGTSRRTLGRNLILPRTQENLADLLTRSYAEVRADAAEKRRRIDQYRKGDLLPGALSEDEKSILRKTLRGHKIDFDDTPQSDVSQFQAFTKGYVWRYAKGLEGRAKQVREVVLLNDAEIQDLVQGLERIVDYRHNGPRRAQAAKEGLRGLIIALVGEQKAKENISFEEAIMKRMGLRANRGLLRLRPKNGQLDIPLQDIEEIYVRAQRLSDIRLGKERDWTGQTVVDGQQKLTVYLPGATRTKKRWFTIPGASTRYYWLDVETEIP